MSKDWQKKALELRDEGYTNRAIGRKLGKDESVVRRYFKRLGEFYDEDAGSECNHSLGELIEKYGEVDNKTSTVGVMGTPVYWDTGLGDFTTDGITNWNPHPAQLEMINKDHGFKMYDGAAGSECNHTLEELLKKYREVDEKYKVKDNSRILVISDMHIPYHHPDTLAFLQHLKEKYEPTRVICLGDELDKHSLSFHDSDPNLPSAGDELKLALPVIQKLKEMFPVMDILESNHGSLLYRKAHASGIPKQYLKSYNEVLGVDSGWQWHYDMVVDLPNGQKCYFHHGKSANVTKTSQTMSMCSVQGHFHETFKIEYWANPIALYWAMQTGCLIDDKSYAFNYNNVNLKRPIIGTGLIIDSQPILEPMVLLNDGRWIRR